MPADTHPQPPDRARRAAGVMRAIARVAVAIAGFGASVGALAQTAEQSLPPLSHDRGVRTGEFTLYPSFAVMGHYDTNLFNGDDAEPGNRPRGAASLRLMPRLVLVNDPSSNITLNFNGVGDARIYFSGDNAAIAEQQAVGGNVGLDIKIGQRRSFSFSFFDYFVRALRASNWETTTTFNRVANDVGARVEFHPGDIPERRPLVISFASSLGFDWFDDFELGNTRTIRNRLTGSWKFLPKTAAIIDSTWDVRTYQTTDLADRKLSFNSTPFRVKAGLNGALTKRISAQALAGWGLSAHDGGSSFNSFLATVGVGVRASESTRFFIGYDHDYIDSYLSNFADVHRFSASLRQRFGQILDVNAVFATRILTYGDLTGVKGNAKISGLTTCGTGACRRDIALDGGLNATFEVARLVGMNIGYLLRSVQTKFKVLSNSGAVLDVGQYTAHEIYASLVLRY